MFGRTAQFFSGYIYKGSNKVKMAAVTLLDFTIFLVNALPIVIVANHEDQQKTGVPDQFYTAFGISLVLGQVLPRLRNLLLDAVAVDVQTELSSSMHNECFERPMEQHLGVRVGQLSKALFSNYMSIEKIVPSLYGEILPTFGNTVVITTIIAARYSSYGWATIIPAGLFAVDLGAALVTAKFASPARQMVSGKKHQFFGTALESAGNYTIAHQFGNVSYEVTKVRTILEEGRPVNLHSRRIDSLANLGYTFVNYSGLIGFFIASTQLYNNQQITQYDFAAIGYLMAYQSRNLDALGPAVSELAIAYQDAKDIVAFHTSNPVAPLPSLQLHRPPTIRFDNVNFSFNSKDEKGRDIVKKMLRNFNLEIKAGETVAIVGDSGIGKSTIFNLLQGFYKPDTGRIFINNTDISTVSPQSLREHITTDSQDANLFNATVQENIKYGKMNASQDQIKEVAKLAGLESTVEVKNEQPGTKTITIDKKDEAPKDPVDKMLATSVGEKGTKISGGERQRVAFARACLKGGLIFLADEPTSALDPKAEEKLLDTLFRVKQDATTLIITHKLYTLTQVDNICVIDAGQVLEQGTFASLLAKKGKFYTLLEAQCRELGIPMDRVVPRAREEKVKVSSVSITRNWAERMNPIEDEHEINTRVSPRASLLRSASASKSVNS